MNNLFATLDPPKYSNSNSPNLCFCLLKGDKKTFLLVENIFWTNENVFLSHFNKQKQRFVELEFEHFGGSDVVNKLYIILSQLCLVETTLPVKDLGQQTHNCSSYSSHFVDFNQVSFETFVHSYNIFFLLCWVETALTCQRFWSTDTQLQFLP